MGVRFVLLGLAFVGMELVAVGGAEARAVDDCKRSWARAVRSYVTRSKAKVGPDGVPSKSLDDEERVAQDWFAVFSEACALEADGDKPGSRLEAALSAARSLIQVDPPACTKFMRYYMGSTRPQDVCDMVRNGVGSEGVRRTLESSIPPR